MKKLINNIVLQVSSCRGWIGFFSLFVRDKMNNYNDAASLAALAAKTFQASTGGESP